MSFGPPENSPLNNRDHTRLQEALANLALARRKADLAKAAGIDCDGIEANCDFLQDRIEKLKAVYFPHKA